jgi:TusA-related sulfurtransferase
MTERILVDARGLSCPQPVLETKKAVDAHAGKALEVLVSSVTSRENVSRFARGQGFRVSSEATRRGTSGSCWT